MKRSMLSLMLIALLSASAVGQEPPSSPRANDGERNPTAQRQQTPRPQYRRRPTIEVKDPNEFGKTQEKELFSGPQAKEKLPAFNVKGVQGKLDGKQFDPVELAEGKPQILIFQDENGVGLRGLLGFARAIASVTEKTEADIQFTAVFVGDDPAVMADLAKKVSNYLPDFVQLSISPDGREGPGAYGLDRTVGMTVLLAREGKVVHNFAFPQGMLYPDPHVMGGVAEIIGEKRETVAAWVNAPPSERAAMQRAGQRQPAANRAGNLAAFSKRLGELVQAGKLTREEAAELHRLAVAANGNGEMQRDQATDERRPPAEDPKNDDDDAAWERKYRQLLKDRPEIRRKVESGGATKEDVIEWLKKGGDDQKKNATSKLNVEDPAKFQQPSEQVIYSGPQPGEKLPPFKATVFRGEQKGEVHDPTATAGDKPLVLIFQDNSVVGQKGLLVSGPALAKIAAKAPEGLVISTTFLVDDPSPNAIFEYDFVDKISNAIDMNVSLDGRDGPGPYGLNRNVAMTILLARDGKVTHNFTFPQPMLYPDPHLLGGIAELIGERKETVAEWLKEAGPKYK